MRISVIILFSAIYICCQPASGQSFKVDYESLLSLEKDFSDAEQGLHAALQGKFDGNAEYRCVSLVLDSSSHMKDIFSQYKFSVAIRDVVKGQEDKTTVGALLKTQTDLMQSELQRYHRRLTNGMIICRDISLAVTKATELLIILEKGEAAVKLIADKLQWLKGRHEEDSRLATHVMFFDVEISETVRKAVADGRSDLLYVMVPAMDGGQTYEMKCKICGESGNILASRFSHAEGCPVAIEEKRSNRRVQK